MALFATAILYDVIASRPTDNSVLTEGRLFYASDTNALYRDNSTTWDELTLGGGGGGGDFLADGSVPMTGDFQLVDNAILLTPIAAPAAPGSGYLLYLDTNGVLNFENTDGNVFNAGSTFGVVSDHADIVTPSSGAARLYVLDDATVWVKFSDDNHYAVSADITALHKLFSQTADQTISNTSSATTLFSSGVGSLTIPANYFHVGSTLRLRFAGVYGTKGSSPGTLGVSTELSGLSAGTPNFDLPAGVSSKRWNKEVEITCRSTGGTGTFVINGFITLTITNTATPISLTVNFGSSGTLDTTNSLTIDAQAQFSLADTNNNMIVTQAMVEYIP